MDEIIPFDYHGKTITVLTKDDGSIWFYANEICRIAGFANPRDAISNHIRPHQKDVVNGDTPGGTQKLTIINEGGLYRLLLRTKLKAAHKFQDWVTDTVIPAIRKTGGYQIQQLSKVQILEMALESERKRLALEERNKQIEPKAKIYDLVSSSTGLVCLSDCAKIIDIRPHTFTRLLVGDGYCFIRRGKHVPYEQYINKGWFEMKLVPARDGSKSTYRQAFITPLGVNKFREIYNPEQRQMRIFA